ncbi:hypothetical protein E2C01_056747 [Portunus trituberculatus]|uniref:Uncharacterized protein n=1 Tax=Portunus trituberculatus TaxID=210409 RepID=A0A5B7H0F8_PORTR|nr:hypothetical protein [Portunus trituberculatus]
MEEGLPGCQVAFARPSRHPDSQIFMKQQCVGVGSPSSHHAEGESVTVTVQTFALPENKDIIRAFPWPPPLSSPTGGVTVVTATPDLVTWRPGDSLLHKKSSVPTARGGKSVEGATTPTR